MTILFIYDLKTPKEKVEKINSVLNDFSNSVSSTSLEFLSASDLTDSKLILTDSFVTLKYVFNEFKLLAINTFLVPFISQHTMFSATDLLDFGAKGVIYESDSNIVIRRKILEYLKRAETFASNLFVFPKTLEKVELFFKINNDINKINHIINNSFLFVKDLFEGRKIQFETAVYEAVFNSIEHGNLEIDYDLKQSLIEQNEYDNFLQKRLKEDKYKNRKIYLHFKISDTGLELSIKDDGEGFDWQSVKEKIDSDEMLLSGNGRGLKIISSVFDSVFFNEKGNILTLVKLRKKLRGFHE